MTAQPGVGSVEVVHPACWDAILYTIHYWRSRTAGKMAPPVLTTSEEFKQLVDSTDTFLLDCDGVIYHGPVVVEGVKETLAYLRSLGAQDQSFASQELIR